MSESNLMVDLRSESFVNSLGALETLNPGLSSLLAVYPEEMTDKIIKNKDKLDKVIKSFNNLSGHSQNAMVMTCNTETCPYKAVCILIKNNIAPTGHMCPIEKKIALDLEFEVMQSLKIERNNPIEMELLWDLIDAKILDMRVSGHLKDGAVVQLCETSLGNKIASTKTDVSPALIIKLEIKKLKHSIIDAFLASRRAQKKYGLGESGTKTLEQLILEAASSKRKLDNIEDVSG